MVLAVIQKLDDTTRQRQGTLEGYPALSHEHGGFRAKVIGSNELRDTLVFVNDGLRAG